MKQNQYLKGFNVGYIISGYQAKNSLLRTLAGTLAIQHGDYFKGVYDGMKQYQKEKAQRLNKESEKTKRRDQGLGRDR